MTNLCMEFKSLIKTSTYGHDCATFNKRELKKMGQISSAMSAVKAADESKNEAKATSTVSSNTKKQHQKHPFGSKLSWFETRHIESFLETKDLYRLSITSQAAHKALNNSVLRRGAQILLEHTVKGEEDQAKKILETNPKLLLSNSAETIDFSGKLITELTALQAALCAGDTDMVKMMRPYFDKLEDGSQLLAEQIDAVFLEGYDAHLHAQNEATFNFDNIFTTIAHASDDDTRIALSLSGAQFEQSDEARSKDDSELTLIEALNRFREALSQHSLSETTYNPQHLIKALSLYWSVLDNDWSLPKRDLFYRQVIGFCQRFVPACTAQAFAQGLAYLIDAPVIWAQPVPWKAERFKRSLKFRYGGGSIYPIKSRCSGLGFNYGLNAIEWLWWGAWPEAGLPFFENFIRAKSKSLRAIISGSITPARDARP